MKAKSTLKKQVIKPTTKIAEKHFPIVAIGASVGGLEAITSLLKKLPANTGMAFIYVQHLSPDHKSFLPSILSKITKMNVQEIENMERMSPNNLYIIPHNKGIEVTDGHIKLLPRSKGVAAISIDVLFSSLAQTHKANTIGIILSGNAKDGTKGLKAIKDVGGVTFAQDESAQASSMPNSAIASGVVDFILSPEEMAKKLTQLSKNKFPKKGEKLRLIELEDNDADLKSILEILHKETGVDFSQYKMPTIKRRLNHKMQQHGINSIKEYSKLLQKKTNEIGTLYKDLLINVTSFFRDKDAFNYLKTTFLPKLIKSKSPGEVLRIWVPACSTGQEAYSIAMLISEIQANKLNRVPVQIFATDLSEPAITEARVAEYSQSDVSQIPKKYLEKFFTKTGNNYRVVKELREMCVFAPHNILRDPPFSKMDFISCCNLLIYFGAVAQKKTLSTFHFALNDKGTLMLSKAEAIGSSSQLFSRINNKFKIYTKKKSGATTKTIELTPHFPSTNVYAKKISAATKITKVNSTDIENAIDSVLLANYMPACAVVNKDMEILQFRGSVSLFLTHPSGKASLNILKMTRPEFAFELRNAIHKAIKTNQVVNKTDIEIKIDTVYRMMSLEVSPLKVDWDEPLLLIVFTLQEKIEKIAENGKNNSIQKDRRIKKLTEELNSARTEMNSIIETQETTYEELQSANEEIVSTNEEFQTLNEELETSKEEIQATNEELISTNQELQMRNDLLTESQEYSEAIIATVHEPMLVLQKDFRVKSANKSFYKKFRVKREDTEGLLLFELGNKQWNIKKLREVLNEIISKNKGFENLEVSHTFPGIGEKIMLLNAHLIVQKVNSEQLILLAIADVTEVRKLALEVQAKETEKEKIIANKELVFQNIEKEKRAAELIIANKEVVIQNIEKEKLKAELLTANYSRSLIEASLDPLVTINAEGKITDVNNASIKATGITRKKLIGTDFSNYFTEPEKARKGYQQVFDKGFVADYPLTIKHTNGKLIDVLYNASVYKDEKNNVLGVFAAARIVTEQKKIERNLEISLKEVSDYKHALDEFSIVAITDHKGIITHANDNFCKISKYTKKELIGKDHRIINSGYHTKEFMKDLWETISSGKIWRGEVKNKAKDGTVYWVNTTIVPFLDEGGRPYQYVAVRTDITDQKRISLELTEARTFAELSTEIAEEAQSKAENATLIAENAVKSKQQFLSNMSHEIRTPMNAIIGFTKVVLKTELSEKQKEYINAIKVSGDALIVLINDILDLAKVDAGKLTFEQSPFKLSASLSAMLHLFEIKIQEKNLILVKEYDDTIPEILEGDPVRLHQIILNLLSNAVKFTSKGKITVAIRKQKEDEKTVTIEFEVTDTGIGIADNMQKNIFDDFQQATSETSKLYGGTGLGLAIVKQLVESQGGSVKVKSKVGKGSSFSFILDFKKTKAKAQPELNIASEQKLNLQSGKILVVEDIPLNQLLMKTLLEDFGFELDIAENGKIAIEKLKKNNYNIILMDLQMPEMNGFEATEYIRKKMRSQIPIIALTADVTTVDLAKCKAVGMNDYISKPVDEKTLYKKIVQHLKLENEIKDEENIPTKSYINLESLKRRTKHSPALMMEMISLYLKQTPQLISFMKEGVRKKDWKSISSAAHKMIPSFSIVGISKEFEDMAKNIHELALEQKQINEINSMVLELENVCEQACKELIKEYNAIKN